MDHIGFTHKIKNSGYSFVPHGLETCTSPITSSRTLTPSSSADRLDSGSTTPNKYSPEIKSKRNSSDSSVPYEYFEKSKSEESAEGPTTLDKLSSLFTINPKYWFEDEPVTTSLHESVKKNSINDIKKIMLQQPNLINAKNKEGDTPLFIAIRNICIESVCLLLEAGAVVGIKNKTNETPYSIAQNVSLYRKYPGDSREQILDKIIEYDLKERRIMRSRIY